MARDHEHLLSRGGGGAGPPRPEPIPFVGDTWLRRGAPYWGRRVGLHLVWFLTACLVGGVGFGLARGFYAGVSSAGAREAVWGAVGLISLAALGFGWVQGRRRLADPLPPEQARARRAGRMRTTSRLALAGRPVAMILGCLVGPATGAYFLGYFGALTFTRDFQDEPAARLVYQNARREHENRRS